MAYLYARELRVGNYILVNNEPTEVDTLEEYEDNVNFGYYAWGEKYYAGDIKPIPLTKEIFLKCGAEKGKGGGGSLDIHLLGIDFPIISAVVGVVQDARGNILINGKGYTYTEPKIEYLHQLQNFYYANVGEELEVNFKN